MRGPNLPHCSCVYLSCAARLVALNVRALPLVSLLFLCFFLVSSIFLFGLYWSSPSVSLHCPPSARMKHKIQADLDRLVLGNCVLEIAAKTKPNKQTNKKKQHPKVIGFLAVAVFSFAVLLVFIFARIFSNTTVSFHSF